VSQKLDIYKCADCPLTLEVLTPAGCEPECCGKPMTRLQAKTADQGKEKHVPVVEKTPEGIKVKVGSVPHPMEEKHYIEWIEVLVGDKAYRAFLKPGQTPEATFPIKADLLSVREHCNVHGLWKA